MIAFAAPAASGCSEATPLFKCIEEADAIRVDEISTLENALAVPRLHDAPTITAPVGDAIARRVVEVQVLVMMPQGLPRFYADVQRRLTVEVFAGADPRTSEGYRLTQVVDPSALAWTDVFLEQPESTPFQSFRAAWWTFDFSDLIPKDQSPTEQLVVGIAWPDRDPVLVGYSNFDLSCAGLWGIYPAEYGLPKPSGGVYGVEDGWIDVSAGGGDCSYPMLRVVVEDTLPGEC